MFVKIVYPNSSQVGLYECDRVFQRKHLQKTPDMEDQMYLVLEMEKEGKSLVGDGIGLWFGSEHVQIYIMNENGRTIDSILWSDGEYK